MAPSLPEDMLSLDTSTTSELSSPMSTTLSYGSHTRGYSNPVGLGISGCGTELHMNQLSQYPHSSSFDATPQMPHQIMPAHDCYSIPVKVEDYSHEPFYGLYNYVPETTPSPMSYYGSHAMSASPSYNSPMEMTAPQAPFSVPGSGYWASASRGPMTPPDMGSNPTNTIAVESWSQHLYPSNAPVNAMALPVCPALSITPDTYSSTGAMETSPAEMSLMTPPKPAPASPKPRRRSCGEDEPKRKSSKTSKRKNSGPATPPRRKPRPDAKFPCKFCDFKFTRRSNCSEHEKNARSEE
ncbi:hypothetical protein N7468_003656 [Penicillium chermesinum]|uniref:C2H2-type domain-containing protein n=1 Tax=Penicillium chermesinum TaxID=63820 RepID=A0A9W9P9Q9_9EURO|nr:uncharacterized protein N7468_003656 [Penicillium chermesinum]KAJ5239037.1 hypothetical protein N7468_003656 [Penicillium chermesinum]